MGSLRTVGARICVKVLFYHCTATTTVLTKSGSRVGQLLEDSENTVLDPSPSSEPFSQWLFLCHISSALCLWKQNRKKPMKDLLSLHHSGYTRNPHLWLEETGRQRKKDPVVSGYKHYNSSYSLCPILDSKFRWQYWRRWIVLSCPYIGRGRYPSLFVPRRPY